MGRKKRAIKTVSKLGDLLRKTPSFLLLVFCCWLLIAPPGVGAQGAFENYGLRIRFGPHLACSNNEDFIRETRKEYKLGEWEAADWFPATVMFKITDPTAYLKAGLEAMTSEFEETPKFWPIIRIDGDPHGDRITEEEVDGFVEHTIGYYQRKGCYIGGNFVEDCDECSRNNLICSWHDFFNGGVFSDFRNIAQRNQQAGVIFLEFANEPNHQQEWKPAIDPVNYGQMLDYFVKRIDRGFQEAIARGLMQAGDEPHFKVANAAMDQRAPNSPITMEAIEFWRTGNLGSIAVSLDGYAFNTYHFEDTRGRHSKYGWKFMAGPAAFNLPTDRPYFLLEYGRDPGLNSLDRKEFIEDEYQLDYLDKINDAVIGVTAITPLLCVDKDCKQIDTAIFGKNGNVGWEISDGQGSCSVAVTQCGQPGIVGLEGMKNDDECWQKNTQLGQAPFDERREGAETGAQAQGISTQGFAELVCSVFGRIPYFGPIVERILCRTAYLSQDLRSIQLTADRSGSGTVSESVDLMNGTLGFGIDPDDVWRVIGKNASDPQTGFLATHLPSVVNQRTEGISDVEQRTLTEHNNLRFAWTPQLLNRGVGGHIGPGPGTGTRPIVRNCKPADPMSECGIEKLKPYFGNDDEKARKASIICNAESGANQFALNDGCLYGISADYSVGLFQINLLVHYCPEAFASYRLDPPSCTVADWDRLNECVEEHQLNPEINIREAVRISSGGTNWSPWATAPVCGIN